MSSEVSTKSLEKGGRPRLRPPWIPKRADEVDPAEVERMAEEGCSSKVIAGVLDTDVYTIDNHFGPELTKGRSRRTSRLFAKQYDLAVKQGNVSMLIWLGKQEGQTDRQESAADYKTFEVIIGEPIQNNRLPSPAGSVEILEEQGPS